MGNFHLAEHSALIECVKMTSHSAAAHIWMEVERQWSEKKEGSTLQGFLGRCITDLTKTAPEIMGQVGHCSLSFPLGQHPLCSPSWPPGCCCVAIDWLLRAYCSSDMTHQTGCSDASCSQMSTWIPCVPMQDAWSFWMLVSALLLSSCARCQALTVI